MLNFYGIIIAFASFFVIGIFHPIVIKGEYYFSEKIWSVFLTAGILFCAVSVFTDRIISVLCALMGSACLWSIKELKEQRTRVQKDRFPQNKKKKSKCFCTRKNFRSNNNQTDSEKRQRAAVFYNPRNI